MSDSDLKIRLKAEGTPEVNQALEGVKRGVEGLAGSVTAATRVVGLFSSALMLYAIAERVVSWLGKVREETAKWARSSREAAQEAERLHLTAGALDAIRQAAEEAGTPIDALDRALADYRNHITTFEELAAAIGSTGDALAAIEAAAAPGRAGRDYLEKLGKQQESEASAEEARKAEAAGFRAATEAIRTGTPAEQREGWDVLMRGAEGDIGRAGELYNTHKSWLNRSGVGVYGFGHFELQAAAGRYQGNQQQLADDRAARIAAHDAEVERRRQAEAEAKKQREEEIAARQREQEEAVAERRRLRAHENEVNRAARDEERRLENQQKAAAMRADLEASTAQKIDSITVDAPKAASSYGTIGGIMGGQVQNAQRLAEQRQARIEAIQLEHTRLLAEISAKLED
ncbi:MAG: hypothetical protein M0Q49_01865 [Porticoccaceae bacterium]|nr:hypothetical protein [Porticoccaceae bacterium]